MINVLYLCEMPAFHISNEVYVLQKHGCRVVVLNLFKRSYEKLQNDEGLSDVELINFYGRLPFYPAIKYLPLYTAFVDKKRLRQIVSEYNIEIIYSSWSSVVLPEAATIKKMFPELRWVHRFLMYPASLNGLKSRFENASIWRYLRYADKVIVHTEAMRSYMTQNVCHCLDKATVLFEKLNELYFCDSNTVDRFSSSDRKFHLVFLGTLTRGKVGREMLEYFQALPERIVVHVLATSFVKSELKGHSESIQLFEKKSVGHELTCFIRRFDGVLALYPKDSSSSFRVDNVIPNRITLALPAQVPIYIPDGQLRGAQVELDRIGILEIFRSGDHLLERLENRASINYGGPAIDEKNIVLGAEFVDVVLNN